MRRKEYISDDEYLIYQVTRSTTGDRYNVSVTHCQDSWLYDGRLDSRSATANTLEEVEETIERLNGTLMKDDPLEKRVNETIDRLHG